MKIADILSETRHRPWELPKGNWKFYQEWNNVVFLHYKVDLNELQKFVHEELEIDVFEGKAWVSVVAFTMEKIRPRNLPSISLISNFDEINIRTYVKRNNKTGVYFLSIEGGKQLSCKIAKQISELPYRYSEITRKNGLYTSKNKQFSDSLNLEFQIGNKKSKKTNLDVWLTERYALFQDGKTGMNEFETHHLEWEISEIDFTNIQVNYQRFNKLISNQPNLIHYSKGVQVLAWNKTKV